MGLTTQKYDILARIAIGNGSLVYRGVDKVTLRQVALKLLTQDGEQDHRFDVGAMFATVPLIRLITGSHVCQLLDAIEDDDGPVLVYEFANGMSGAEFPLKRTLDATQAVDVSAQIMSSLRSGERQRTPHGDMKPSNLVFVDMPEGRPFVLVLDWGMAAFRAELMKDSLPYAAPERLLGGPVSHAADLFSAGAVLFYLLTGKVLAMGETREELLEGWARARPELLAEIRPDLSPKLVAWICSLLALDADKRPASAVDASNALAALSPPPPMVAPESIRPRPIGAAQRAYLSGNSGIQPRPSGISRPIPSGVNAFPSGVRQAPAPAKIAVAPVGAGTAQKSRAGLVAALLIVGTALAAGAAWWFTREKVSPIPDIAALTENVRAPSPSTRAVTTPPPATATESKPKAASAPQPKPADILGVFVSPAEDFIALEDFSYPEDSELDGAKAGTGWVESWKGGGARVEKASLTYPRYPAQGGRMVLAPVEAETSVSRKIGQMRQFQEPGREAKWYWYFSALVKHTDGGDGAGGPVRLVPFEADATPVQIVFADMGRGLRVSLSGVKAPHEEADGKKPVFVLGRFEFSNPKDGKWDVRSQVVINPKLDAKSIKEAGKVMEATAKGVRLADPMRFDLRKLPGRATTELDELRYGRHWREMSFRPPKPPGAASTP